MDLEKKVRKHMCKYWFKVTVYAIIQWLLENGRAYKCLQCITVQL